MLTVVLAVAVALLAGVTPASANASGCTAAYEKGAVCGTVGGDGLYVDWVEVSRSKPDWPFGENVCDYQGVVTVYNSGGSRIYQQRSGVHAGCVYLVGYVDLSVGSYFPNNSKITLSFYEEGAYQGAVSFKITG
ncbi:hypothetical protein [Amycolatopsis sp.]|uniref:hypothetical protein n=1 Tax=Amycolatopsis sp. TaxID=37632 RepID=UPI002D7E7BB4|nr:hypothetical protein [Amycolatopsis sp.]HET6707009.1 hypothetical protein [Amycolatopsis sp.]